jgi:putative restriction endonuclease
MRAYVGVTNQGWYEFLLNRPEISEVNFWRPYGSRPFRALESGEPFLFKTKYPQNKIVGGGFYEGFVSLKISQAWEFFGLGNGVDSLNELLERLCSITGELPSEIGDREIGRSYETPGEDSSVDEMVRLLTLKEEIDHPNDLLQVHSGPTRGTPRLTTPRLGQNGFKAVVQEAYLRRCAITNHSILPTLQAAHIFPVAAGGQHRIDNGLLLRSDVHTMFDRGYLGVDQDFRLRVSPRLRNEFGNGHEFYSKEGSLISVPNRESSRPSSEFLSWHLEHVFR